MKKWNRDGYKIEERIHDYDLNKLVVVYKDKTEHEIIFDTIADFSEAVRSLDKGDCIDGWEDGFGNTVQSWENKNKLNNIITTQEAAEILGISERGVRWNCEAGKYKARKAGRVWLIDKESLK